MEVYHGSTAWHNESHVLLSSKRFATLSNRFMRWSNMKWNMEPKMVQGGIVASLSISFSIGFGRVVIVVLCMQCCLKGEQDEGVGFSVQGGIEQKEHLPADVSARRYGQVPWTGTTECCICYCPDCLVRIFQWVTSVDG